MMRKCNVDEERFGKMLATALKQGLFDKTTYDETGCVTSNGIKKRSEVVMMKREKMRERYNIKVSDAETREETTPETRQSKEKKSKEKKSKEEERKEEEKEQHAERVRLTPSEYLILVNRYGTEKTGRLITELNLYKLATGKEYESDYAAIMSWVVKRVEEQDSRPTVMQIGQPSGRPKQNKHGMKVHVQEAESLTDEEWKELNEMIKKQDGDK
jgi:hypothetical protein